MQGPADEETLEAELLRAVQAAGGVLPTNAGSTHRLQLSRSSRTDKGVHSLSTVRFALTLSCSFWAHKQPYSPAECLSEKLLLGVQVIGLKLEVSRDCFETDPEGVELAQSINEHLPSQVSDQYLG